MFLYLTLGMHDLTATGSFYDAVLKTVGLQRLKADSYEIGYGPGGGEVWFWLVHPENQRPASYGNGTMVAFAAPDRAAVDRFHAASLAHGGYDEGKPGLRTYGPDWYACYVRDPAGNKLSAVYNKPI